MNTTRLLLGAVIGTIAVFALDFLFYGMLMRDSFTIIPACDRKMPQWPWLVGGIFIFMFVFNYLYGLVVRPRLAPVQQGLRFGSAIGVLAGFGMGLILYSIQEPHPLSDYIVDGLYTTVKFAVVGVLTAYITGKGGTGSAGDIDVDTNPTPGGEVGG